MTDDVSTLLLESRKILDDLDEPDTASARGLRARIALLERASAVPDRAATPPSTASELVRLARGARAEASELVERAWLLRVTEQMMD